MRDFDYYYKHFAEFLNENDCMEDWVQAAKCDRADFSKQWLIESDPHNWLINPFAWTDTEIGSEGWNLKNNYWIELLDDIVPS